MDVKNSKILITGGSSGIGKETARHFIQKGAKVVITGRDENKLNRVAQEIGALQLLWHSFRCFFHKSYNMNLGEYQIIM